MQVIKRYGLLWLFVLPFAAYGWALWHYCVNVPYWDDFSVILEPLSRAFAEPGWQARWQILLTPNAGHLPFFTHLFSALQVLCTGAVNFRQSALLANTGWLATVLVLLAYYRRTQQVPWIVLLPVPFLLLSITHWEAMDFTTPAWQMYWGSALLPVLCLIAAVQAYWVMAVLAFGLALLFSSGALALVPLLLACSLHKRDRRGMGVVALGTALVLGFFFWFNPPMAQPLALPALAVVVRFVPAFMGNVVATGSWYLGGYAWLHWPMGLAVLFAGWQCWRQPRDVSVAQLLFGYILLLACMAVFQRGAGYGYVVSRYSLFALLALTALYCTLAPRVWRHGGARSRLWIGAAVVVAMLLWLHSYYKCLGVLAYNRDMRMSAAHRYMQGGELGKLLWEEQYGQRVLRQAAAAGVFDTAVWNDLPAQ